jgi:hypothetical protein
VRPWILSPALRRKKGRKEGGREEGRKEERKRRKEGKGKKRKEGREGKKKRKKRSFLELGMSCRVLDRCKLIFVVIFSLGKYTKFVFFKYTSKRHC